MPAVRHSAKSDGKWPPSRDGHLLPSGIFPVLPRARLYRVPSTRQIHLCRVLYFAECGTRQNIALSSAPIKNTRQSLRHSAKYSFPVVFGLGRLKQPFKSAIVPSGFNLKLVSDPLILGTRSHLKFLLILNH